MAILRKDYKVNNSESNRVVTEALIKSADWLGVNSTTLSSILGLSNPTISRMKNDAYYLTENHKEYEISLDFIRIYRSLYSIVSGNQETARAWLANYNTALRGKPIELIQSIRGLYEVSTYLDARRAIV